MEGTLKTGSFDQDRFDRSRRIDWIDMESITSSKVLVVGAGALGNEVVKNLALSGVRDIALVDMDYVVRSNLNRCVFFRETDHKTRAMKADVVAERAIELYPECRIRTWTGRVEEMPWSFSEFDVVFGCLDNILTRLHVNAHSYEAMVPYVDGGTDGLRGKVQVVIPPEGPCMQCSMNSSHQKVLEKRFSCTGTDITYYQPKMAAEITTTSVIAAIQVREGMKILCGREDLCLKDVMYYDGNSGETITLEVELEDGCQNHQQSG